MNQTNQKTDRPFALYSKAFAAIYLIAFGLTIELSPSLAAQPVTSPLPATASTQLPSLGDGSDLSIAAERRLGDRIVRELYRDPDYIDDPVLAEYVQGVWQPLLAAARMRGDLSSELAERFAWEILMGKDRSVNAFALPGGYFGLHLGLLAVVSSRDELASVLGHELSHVTQRHISRTLSRQAQQAPWMLGAMILGALAASKSADVGSALIVGSQASNAQSQLNFSRDMEREADRVGFGIMTQAGFAAQGFVSMFEKLQQASRLNDNGAYPYLRSHPLTTERIADMQSRLAFGAGKLASVTPTFEHAMLSARARVLSNSGVDALRAAVAEADNSNQNVLPLHRQVAACYGAALASSRLRDFVPASVLLDRLQALLPTNDLAARRWLRLLRAEVLLAGGNAKGAAAALDDVALIERRPELLFSAQIALRSGQNASLTEINALAQRLQLWVTSHPGDAQAWQWLSGAYAAQGQTLRSIRADAEAQVAMLDYAAALDRFKAAQDLVQKGRTGADHVDASIVDTRRRQIESILKEQALDR